MNITKTEIEDTLEGVELSLTVLRATKKKLKNMLVARPIVNSKSKKLRQISVDTFLTIQAANDLRESEEYGMTQDDFGLRMQSEFTIRPFHVREIITGDFTIEDCINYDEYIKSKGDK